MLVSSVDNDSGGTEARLAAVEDEQKRLFRHLVKIEDKLDLLLAALKE